MRNLRKWYKIINWDIQKSSRILVWPSFSSLSWYQESCRVWKLLSFSMGLDHAIMLSDCSAISGGRGLSFSEHFVFFHLYWRFWSSGGNAWKALSNSFDLGLYSDLVLFISPSSLHPAICHKFCLVELSPLLLSSMGQLFYWHAQYATPFALGKSLPQHCVAGWLNVRTHPVGWEVIDPERSQLERCLGANQTASSSSPNKQVHKWLVFLGYFFWICMC